MVRRLRFESLSRPLAATWTRRTLLPGTLAVAVALMASCQARPGAVAGRPEKPIEPPPVAEIRQEPSVRVRVVAGDARVTLTAAGPLAIGPVGVPAAQAKPFTPPVTVSRRNGMFVVADRSGQSLGWNLPSLQVQAASGNATVTVNNTAYPASLVVAPTKTATGVSPDRVDVINYVPIEQYLPGVIEHELYPKWQPEAYAAQAIAARSYAIAQQAASADRGFDLESTTASQVYGGQAQSQKAIDAVQRTRGQVLTWDGRVVPAFFSSCSGGVGQDAAIAFPDQKLDVKIPPLQGRPHGWGRTSTSYRWGPITRDTADLSRRIAAWGRGKGMSVANLGTLTHVEVASRSQSGRPATFRLRDHRNQSFILAAEHFRFACNHSGGGVSKVNDKQILKSSNVDVRVQGPSVIFTNGKGYGHGVGLDQWAAEEMAQAGHPATAIVSFFYPGATIERIY